MKDITFQNLNHSLKNNLSAIIGNIDILKNLCKEKLSSETTEILNEIKFNANYMSLILQNASDISKNLKRKELMEQKIEIQKLFENVENFLFPIIPELKKFFTIEIKNNLQFYCCCDILFRFFTTIIYELFKFTSDEQKILLQIQNFEEESIKILISFNITTNQYNLINPEEIFYELFIECEKSSNLLFYNFIRYVIEIYNGYLKILKKNGKVYLQIVLKSPKKNR